MGKGAGNAHLLVGDGESRMFPCEVLKLGDNLVVGWGKTPRRTSWGWWIFLKIVFLVDFAWCLSNRKHRIGRFLERPLLL